MYFPRHAIPLLSLSIAGTAADLIGATYPAPLDLTSSESLVFKSWKNLTSGFDAHLKLNQTSTLPYLSLAENITFSVELFSLNDPRSTDLQYHHTAADVASAQNGTKQVDGDSIYKMASVSKLFTVFAGMLNLTDEEWNRPLTQVIPALAEFAREHDAEADPIYTLQWDKVTPWSLAAQLSGVPTLGVISDILSNNAIAVAAAEAAGLPIPPTALTKYGFPPLNLTVLGPCLDSTCLSNPDGLMRDLMIEPPNFLPWTTPAYSDVGFMILGIAISTITNTTMKDVYSKLIFEPLGMTSSFSSTPTSDHDIARSVTADDTAAEFNLDAGLTVPSGGLFSTVNDLAKFGTNLLNSTLLSPLQTRKWMKPITHTASLTYSVGAPWEIIRFIHPSTGKVTDIYTKLGDSGAYGGFLAVIPEYDAGFCLLNSYNGASRSPGANIVLDYVTQTIVPALEAQAAAEAAQNFVGTYASTDPSLNSSVTISFNESTVVKSNSGLSVSSWISNGTDVLASALFSGEIPHLLPSIPKQSSGAGQMAFQIANSIQLNTYTQASGLGIGPNSGLYDTNLEWLVVDQGHYGGIGVRLFVFDVDAEGRASCLSPAATRATLQRK